MTASLPKPREEALRETLKLRDIELKPIPGPADLERLPRYHKATVENNDPMALVAKNLGGKRQGALVCNTVKRVMDAAKNPPKMRHQPLIYHSRFKSRIAFSGTSSNRRVQGQKPRSGNLLPGRGDESGFVG